MQILSHKLVYLFATLHKDIMEILKQESVHKIVMRIINIKIIALKDVLHFVHLILIIMPYNQIIFVLKTVLMNLMLLAQPTEYAQVVVHHI